MMDKLESLLAQLDTIEARMPLIDTQDEAQFAFDLTDNLIEQIKAIMSGKNYFYGKITNKTDKEFDASGFPSDVVKCIIDPMETYYFPFPNSDTQTLIDTARGYRKHGFTCEKYTGRFGENYFIIEFVVNS